MLFDNLSPKTDFSSKLQYKLDILNKNLLYTTHQCDKILKLLNKLIIDKNLQNTVDEYFEETSHQTDSDNKADLD